MRPAAILLLLGLAAACERRVRAFDALRDAGGDASAADAAPAADAAFPLGDPRFDEPSGAPVFGQLAGLLDGRFQGTTGGAEPVSFELELAASSAGRGTFLIRCSAAPGCDPFGLGSAAAGADGTFRLNHVDAQGQGEGELGWGHGFTATQVEFWQLTRDGQALSFVVGHAGLARELGFYSSVRLERVPEGAAP